MALRQTYLSMKSQLPQGVASVLVMRGQGNDELAPSNELLDEFNRQKAECATAEKNPAEMYHCAWKASDYERRFTEQIESNPASMQRLLKLSTQSHEKDIYLICYEGEDKPCHRRLLLEIAERRFGATVDYSPFVPRDTAKSEHSKEAPKTLPLFN